MNNKTKVVCPQCGAEFAIPEHEHVAIGIAIGKDSGLGVVFPSIASISSATEIVSQKSKTVKEMKAEAKLEALRNAGVNVDNLFSMKGINGSETIARVENGQVSIIPDNDPIFAAIMNNGTVNNPKLFRRWVMAQVFHMLATGNFTKALQRKGYEYQWKMVIEELRVQAKMYAHGDMENFLQRNRFFDKDRVWKMACDYIGKLQDHVEKMPSKNCKGLSYITLHGKHIFRSDVGTKVYAPLNNAWQAIGRAKTPEQLYQATMKFYRLAKKTWMVWETPMSAAFKDSYKGAGAYFTMRNMILFHGAKFRNCNGRFMSQKQSLEQLESDAHEYSTEGWRLFGVMKKLIADSGMNINQKIAEWRK